MVEVDQEDVGLGARRQTAEVSTLQEPARAERGGVEDVARQPHLIVRVRDLGQDRGPAQLGHHVHGVRVGAERHGDAGVEITLERVQGHRHLGVLVRAVADGGAGLGQHA